MGRIVLAVMICTAFVAAGHFRVLQLLLLVIMLTERNRDKVAVRRNCVTIGSAQARAMHCLAELKASRKCAAVRCC